MSELQWQQGGIYLVPSQRQRPPHAYTLLSPSVTAFACALIPIHHCTCESHGGSCIVKDGVGNANAATVVAIR